MFDLKTELNERFFEVHKKVGLVYQAFTFDIMVYADMEKIKKKYYRDVKRKRKMKNKLKVLNEQIAPLEKGKAKLINRLRKYMIAYRSALNRYGVPEKKDECLKTANFYIDTYNKMLNPKQQEEKKDDVVEQGNDNGVEETSRG